MRAQVWLGEICNMYTYWDMNVVFHELVQWSVVLARLVGMRSGDRVWKRRSSWTKGV